MRQVFKGRFVFLLLGILLSSVTYAKEKAVTAPESIDGAKTITAVGIIELIHKFPDLVIIDSRMPDRLRGYIEGSVNLTDINTSCESLSKHLKSLKSPVIFYCDGPHCLRSWKAIKIALTCGYQHIYWYRGGLEDWINQDFPYITH